MHDIDLLCLGEPLREFNCRSTAGDNDDFVSGFGGDTSNTAIAAARQGARVGYITRLGQDVFGDDFMALWNAEGVGTEGVGRDAKAPTGIYFVTHGEAGHAFTYFRAGSAASLITPDQLPLELLARARTLHISGISQAISTMACDTVFAAIDAVKAAGGQISYDFNLRLKLWSLSRARAVIHATVPLADVILPSLEDAVALTGLEAPEAIADFYLGLGAGIVVLKLGADGVLLASGEERVQLPGHSVATVDATGAGDTFDGSFLAAMAQGQTPQNAVRYANAAAALSTEGYGAVAPIPYRAEVMAFLDRFKIGG